MAVASLSKPGRPASLNMWCVFKEEYQELTQKSFHMYVKYIYGLTGQAKRYNFCPKDFIFIFG